MPARDGRERLRVFLAYTAEDLTLFADAVARSARRLGHDHENHPDWVATGNPTVKECMAHVSECDILVVIVAHRYGWVPPKDQDGDGEKSITRLEVEEARRIGIPVLPFVIQEDAPWPPKQIEALRDAVAGARLERFKDVLRATIAGFFTTPADLEAAASPAISKAANALRGQKVSDPRPRTEPRDEFTTYRHRIEQKYRRVDLVGFGEQFDVSLPIDELYVPLVAQGLRRFGGTSRRGGSGPRDIEGAEEVIQVPVEDLFRAAAGFGLRGAVLLGPPGCGKTTASRRIVWQCADRMKGPASLGLPDDIVPVLLNLRRFRPEAAARGIAPFLVDQIAAEDLADSPEFGQRLLDRDRLLWVLDGLDEVADPAIRSRVAESIKRTLAKRVEDWFLVTSRYAGYEDGMLGPDLLRLDVKPLDDPQQAEFVKRWYQTVEKSVHGPGAKAAALATERSGALLGILRGGDFTAARLSEMIANPLLLSILCVVYRANQDLPRRRADLYERCLDVLLDSWRKEWRKVQGRDSLDVAMARLVLQPIAWHLHQTDKRTDAADEELVPVVEAAMRRLGGAGEKPGAAAEFLRTVHEDSGLLVRPEPGRYGFLHLSFQEHLAAAHAVDALPADDLAVHFGQPWWNEPVLLALGRAKSDAYVGRFFDVVLRAPGSPVDAKALPLRAPEDEGALFRALLDHAMLKPVEPFVRCLSGDVPPARLALVLHAMRGRKDESLIVAAKSLVEHGDSLVRSAAIELLRASGVEVPGESGTERALELRTEPQTGLVFCRIPAGEFQMGATDLPLAGPVHRVRVPSFWLARAPVTNAQYEPFLSANPAVEKPASWSDRLFNQPDQPVVGVTWDEARAFCVWVGGWLPSEAEREYACRAGTTSQYWSGETEADLARVGWYEGNSDERLHAVGEKPANPYGLFDMHGNAWEWCEDMWHEKYEGAPGDGSAWVLGKSPYRVVRGGSCFNKPRLARSAFRFRVDPTGRYNDMGFRVAASLAPK